MTHSGPNSNVIPGTHPGIEEWFEPALEAGSNCCKQNHRLQTCQANICNADLTKEIMKASNLEEKNEISNYKLLNNLI